MPDIAAFKGIRYNLDAVALAEVTAPPYDVISPKERAALEASSPFNIVRLILGPLGLEDGKYIAARKLLDAWTAQEILVADDEESLYLYEQSFEHNGTRHLQTGILSAVTISEEILPHERTMGPVVEDRLEVIRATEANLSPVFCLYWSASKSARDTTARVKSTAPFAEFATADGLSHRAWRIEDPRSQNTVVEALSDAKVVIADGHHRYRTAEAYRDERRASHGAGPWDRMLLFLVDAEHESPALLPIHRLVRKVDPDKVLAALAPHFKIQPASHDADRLVADLAARRSSGRCYGVLAKERAWIVTLEDESLAQEATGGEEHCSAWRDLDVSVLHKLVFERLLDGPEVTYVHHPREAAQAIDAGQAQLSLLMAPMPINAVRDIAEAKDSMPPKSTFFVPKPRTGIVIRGL